jgi:hypothetical protein
VTGPADPTEERRPGPTPCGGAASVCYWQDAAGNPAPRSAAVAGVIVELDAAGRQLARTYFDARPSGGDRRRSSD